MKQISKFRPRRSGRYGSGLHSSGSRFITGTVCVTTLLCLMFCANAISADEQTAAIENTRTALENWIKTRDLISKEKQDFVLKKEILNERIRLVQNEIESLHTKIKEARNSIAEADKKRQDMMEENNDLKGASVSLQDNLILLEQGIHQLIKRLPDPIRQRIKPLTQRLPENPNETKLSVSERFQNVVGILNEVDKFNREITVTSEVRTFPDGSSVEVAAVYLGIGQAYYASANGAVAGIGTASGDRWVWKEQNDAAPQIADVIAILKNEKVASFVLVPVEIH